MANDPYKPTSKVSMKSLTRDGYKWTAKWSVPAAAVKSGKKNRFDGLHIQWTIDVMDTKSDLRDTDKTGNERTVSNDQTFGEFTKVAADTKKNIKRVGYTRDDFYPKTGKKVGSVSVKVRGYRSHGGKHWGPWSASKGYAFTTPRKPEVTLAYDADAKSVTYTIKTDAGKDNAERYDTYYRVYATRTGAANCDFVRWTSSKSTEIKGTADLSSLVNWSSGAKVVLFVEAKARGLRGDSDIARASYSAAWPAQPVIAKGGITADGRGRVRVPIAIDAGSVQKVTLQRVIDVDPGSTPTGASPWQVVEGGTDNGRCTALYDTRSDALSTNGKYTWYRVMAEGCGFHDYSNAERADCLFVRTPSAEDDKCGIVSVQRSADGRRAAVVVGWDEDNDNTGTEIAWSDDADAWYSTEQPKTFQFGWSDGQSRSADWPKTAAVTIDGLDDGVPYYIQARRYLEGEDKTTYSPWSAQAEVRGASGSSLAVLGAPISARRGDAIPLSWTYDGGESPPARIFMDAGDGFRETADVAGTLGFYNVQADSYGDAARASFYVVVGDGDDAVQSNTMVVAIVDPPACEVCAPDPLTAQPAWFEAYAQAAIPQLLCVLRSSSDGAGCAVEYPGGDMEQLPGDTVWTDAVEPSWSAATWGDTLMRSALAAACADAADALRTAEGALEALADDDPGHAAAAIAVENARAAKDSADADLAAHPADGPVMVARVQAASDADLVDGASYEFSCVPRDVSTGLSGDASTCGFYVEWDHRAPKPSDDIEVSVDAEARSATITLFPPEGSAGTDVYDIYRRVPGGHVLVIAGLAMDAVVTDPYAPFGRDADLYYRICTRTADGDMAFDDYPYELPADVLRFDWGSGMHVELPCNLSLSDSYSKDFEARSHADGTVGGYFGRSVSMSGRYSSEIIKVRGIDQVDSVRKMAEFPGPVFCRTHDGMAFQCNADVSNIGIQGESASVAVSFGLTKVALTREFMLSPIHVAGEVEADG